MKQLSIVLFAVAVAACGGKSKGPAATGSAEGDDPATPFNDGQIKASLSAMTNIEGCGVDASTTLGAHFEQQKKALEGEGEDKGAVEESFLCRARADDAWDCEWSVFSKPDAPAAPADPCAAAGEEGEDPCAGECCSGYQILFQVSGSDLQVKSDSVHCIAPG